MLDVELAPVLRFAPFRSEFTDGALGAADFTGVDASPPVGQLVLALELPKPFEDFWLGCSRPFHTVAQPADRQVDEAAVGMVIVRLRGQVRDMHGRVGLRESPDLAAPPGIG